MVQLGFLIPDTAWEIAGKYDVYKGDAGGSTAGAKEWGAAINYYIDGHSDKVTLDISRITPNDDGNFQADAYPGYNVTFDSDAWLLRLQWQLAL